MTLVIPEHLARTAGTNPERREWVERLPDAVRRLESAWSLKLGPPFDGSDVTASWTAPALRRDGSRAVLKVPMPHMEAEQEAEGLRFWAGDPTVRLLEADASAMLLECCGPGDPLRRLPEPDQDVVIGTLLPRLWRVPPPRHGFRPLSDMTRYWADETMRAASRWPDAGLVREGLSLFRELSRPSSGDVLLATDLHAGNILTAERKPWLVIDPKPFLGDPAYDATQHLLNCRARLWSAADATIDRVAGLLGLRADRVRLWLFARAASEPREVWDTESVALARILA